MDESERPSKRRLTDRSAALATLANMGVYHDNLGALLDMFDNDVDR